MNAHMMFQPPLVLDSNEGDAAKNFPISLRIYSAASDKTELYRLRYLAFLDAGWIPSNPERLFVDRYDALRTTFAVGAFHNKECIGSLRLAFSGADGLTRTMPCEEQFPEAVRSVAAYASHSRPSLSNVGSLARPGRLVEFSRMAIEPSLDNKSFRTTLYASLVRAGLILATASEVHAVVIAVHQRISAFYQAMCGFKVMATSESYAGIAEPTHFLALQFGALDARRRRRNAFFAFSPEEIETARHTLLTMAPH